MLKGDDGDHEETRVTEPQSQVWKHTATEWLSADLTARQPLFEPRCRLDIPPKTVELPYHDCAVLHGFVRPDNNAQWDPNIHVARPRLIDQKFEAVFTRPGL
jgi:hypothetical protein